MCANILTQRQFRVPTGWYITLWFSGLQPLEEILRTKIEITLKIEQAVLYFYIKGTRSLRFKYSKIPHVESI